MGRMRLVMKAEEEKIHALSVGEGEGCVQERRIVQALCRLWI